jgi:hypothetical protein
VVEHGFWWPGSHRHLEEDGGRRRPSPGSSELVDELTDALITRPTEPELFRMSSEPPIDRGDRNAAVVELG